MSPVWQEAVTLVKDTASEQDGNGSEQQITPEILLQMSSWDAIKPRIHIKLNSRESQINPSQIQDFPILQPCLGRFQHIQDMYKILESHVPTQQHTDL